MLKFLMSNFLSLLIFPTNFIVIFSLIGLGITGRSAQSAVSSGDSLKAGSFIEAVKKEDINLLEKRIRVRLAGPLSDFIEELYFTTKERRNIFHYLAGVETKREEFAVILEGLIRLVDPSFFPTAAATVTLAGITFSLEKHPPAVPGGSDVTQQKLLKLNSEISGSNLFLDGDNSRQKKMEKVDKEMSAVSTLVFLHERVTEDLFPKLRRYSGFFPYEEVPTFSALVLLHTGAETEDLFPTALYRNHLLYEKISAFSALAYLHTGAETEDLLLTALYRNHHYLNNLEKGGDLQDSYLNNNVKVFHLAEDNQNISPRELAARNENLQALNVLNQMKTRDALVTTCHSRFL